MRNRIRRNPGRYRAIAYALLVHVVVIAGLVIGFRWTSSPTTATPENTIQAVVAEDPEKKKLEDERRRAEEERKKAEAERKRQDAEAQRKREEERRLEERHKKEEVEKQRQAEQKRKQEEDTKRREEERKKVEAETERKARKKQEDEESRKAAEASLKQQLADEEKTRAAAARTGRAASEMDKYKPLIQQKVTRNWTAVGTSPGLECLVRVRLAPGGEVLQATVIKGSGNPIFDRSVPPAVYKASPLPIPNDPDLFEYYREIDFIFKPR